MERSSLLEIYFNPVDMDAATADEDNNMSIGGASVGGFPAGNIIHQYADDLSLEEADMYERRLEKMQKGKIASTKLKTAPPPLNKGRAGIDQAAFLLRYFVEVAEYLSAGIPGQNCYD